jgi:uncharacterized small protein (DUF1192 family)
MGLFDKKTRKHDDSDNGNGVSEEHHVAQKSQPNPIPDHSAPVRATPLPPPERPMERPGFSINKAIELIRALPDDNMELVVTIVRATLESVNIKVSTIIDDAARKQTHLEARIGVLSREIAALEAEVAVRQQEIASLEADYKETSTVKDWLVVAETLGKPEPAQSITIEAAEPTRTS